MAKGARTARCWTRPAGRSTTPRFSGRRRRSSRSPAQWGEFGGAGPRASVAGFAGCPEAEVASGGGPAADRLGGCGVGEPSGGMGRSPGGAVGAEVQLVLTDAPVGAAVLPRQVGEPGDGTRGTQIELDFVRQRARRVAPPGVPVRRSAAVDRRTRRRVLAGRLLAVERPDRAGQPARRHDRVADTRGAVLEMTREPATETVGRVGGGGEVVPAAGAVGRAEPVLDCGAGR